MINILIVTHGDFGKELVNSSEMVIGKTENIECISFKSSDTYSELSVKVQNAVEKLSGEDLIVFTDMYGGSPFNAVSRLMKNNNFYHITGVNFPLFLEVAINKNSYSMQELVDKIIMNGKKSVVFVNERYAFD